MPERSLGVNPDANVEISAGETGWEAFCNEDFCQREEGWMTYRQAQKWRTAHRKAHARGEVDGEPYDSWTTVATFRRIGDAEAFVKNMAERGSTRNPSGRKLRVGHIHIAFEEARGG